jgi:hypothetical protein
MLRIAASILLVFSLTAVAHAGIIGVTGDFLVIPSVSASYIADPFNDVSPAPIRIWTEQLSITLGSDVLLDTDLLDPTKFYVTAGAGAGEVAFGPGGGPTLDAGIRVNVYYVYFDPLNDSARGTVTFGEEILGIVAYTDRLQFSDFLRVPGAPYPGNPAFDARGWEDTERGNVDALRTTFTLDATATSPGDQFRIFTLASVPEPSTLTLIGVGLAALVLRRRAS